jgi:diguanylate cyclase (GGDEF)-like protein
MVREVIIRIGLVRGVLLATAVATTLSVLITYAIMAFKGMGINEVALTISILAPLSTAPFLFWPLFSSLIKVHHLEVGMRKLAMIDELTGIMNRRAFLTNAEYAISVAQRSQMELALAYIDLDNFKTINDVHGHAGGDEVLRSFARIIDGLIRKSDLVGRLGGEEFALIVYGAGKDAARHLIEKILAEIRSASVEISGVTIRFTASAGLAYFDAAEHEGVEQLLAQADKALLHAKNAGKDCVIVHEEI